MAADNARVDELLSRWQEAHGKGQDLTVEDLCPDNPELAAALKQKIAEKHAFQDMDTRVFPHPGESTDDGVIRSTSDVLSAEIKLRRLALARPRRPRRRLRRHRPADASRSRHQVHQRAASAEDPENRAQFLRESEVTSRLEHPGVVPVHGVGTGPDGRPFYVMRFIQGESLEAAICRFHQGRLNAEPTPTSSFAGC